MRSAHDLHTPAKHRWRAALLVLPLAGLGIGTAVIASPGFAGAAAASPATAAAPVQAAAPAATHVVHKIRNICRTPKPGYAMCDSLEQTDSVAPAAAAATPSGYGPSDIQSAYALSGDAGGRTVAIVDAYNLPTAANDLAAYRSQYGLPACTTASGCFRQLSQTGTSTLPSTDAGWGQEIALDMDMVSAACPSCKILLIEANSSSNANLAAGVNEAVSLGASAVSNSYGGAESSSETSTDSSYNHAGVAITASAGDGGYGVEYPAASKYVTAVGGTSLTRTTANSRGWTESVWGTANNANGGTGSGCSSYETKPTFQTDTGCAKRTVADVSAVADPQTGVAVYDSTSNSGQVGWQVFGGTSASSPIIASVFTLAGSVASGVQANTYPYAGKSHLNDVTSGTNGSCSGSYLCTGEVGYDGPTGLGTPNGTAAFTAAGASPTPTPTPTTSASPTPSPTPSPSKSATPTPTPSKSATPTPTASCTATQVIGNPGFETGTAAPWTASTGIIDNSSSEASHSGSWKAWLDGYGSTHTDTLSQSLAIPAGCKTAALSFYLHIDTAETGSTAYDTLSVQVLNSSGTVLTTLGTLSNANAATGYTQYTASLASYIGQTVTLKFTGTEDSSNQTSFVIDDTALNVS